MAASLYDSTSHLAEHTPEIALKHILHATNMPKELRVKVAKAGFLTVDFVANSAFNVEHFLKAAEVLLGGGEAIGGIKAVAYIKEEVPARSRLAEDPLLPNAAPHKRFVEQRLIRDVIVHESISVYKLGEIRLASEPIVHRSGISEKLEKLLEISEQELPATVKDATDAINHRVFHCPGVSWAPCLRQGVVSGGAITYLDELRERSGATPGLRFVVMADEKIRSKVQKNMIEHGDKFSRYADALHDVLTNHKDIWSECRMECLRRTDKRHDTDDDSEEFSLKKRGTRSRQQTSAGPRREPMLATRYKSSVDRSRSYRPRRATSEIGRKLEEHRRPRNRTFQKQSGRQLSRPGVQTMCANSTT